MENELVKVILEQTELLFDNMQIAMKTCDRNYEICEVPAWRYFYHTLHSCDKWFINPARYDEPAIHVENLDKVDIVCEKVLTDEDLWHYFHEVKNKVFAYLSSLNDQQLYEKPEDCEFTVMELILGQYRHFMCHVGIFNGITIAKANKYPIVLGLDNNKLDGKLYDE